MRFSACVFVLATATIAGLYAAAEPPQQTSSSFSMVSSGDLLVSVPNGKSFVVEQVLEAGKLVLRGQGEDGAAGRDVGEIITRLEASAAECSATMEKQARRIAALEATPCTCDNRSVCHRAPCVAAS